MLKTINNIINKDELLEIQAKIQDVKKKRRNYIDNGSKGDNVQRRAAILQIYNDEIQKLSCEYVKMLTTILDGTNLDDSDIELFKNIMKDTNKTIDHFITKNIKDYGLEKVIINKIPEDVLINELERLIDEYLPIYAMQNVHNISTGYLKGKSRNIYSKICYIARHYNLDVTTGRLLYSILKLDISNREKVENILEVDKIVDNEMKRYISIKRQEFKQIAMGKDTSKQDEIAKAMEDEAINYRKSLYKREYTQKNIEILNDKRILSSLLKAF